MVQWLKDVPSQGKFKIRKKKKTNVEEISKKRIGEVTNLVKTERGGHHFQRPPPRQPQPPMRVTDAAASGMRHPVPVTGKGKMGFQSDRLPSRQTPGGTLTSLPRGGCRRSQGCGDPHGWRLEGRLGAPFCWGVTLTHSLRNARCVLGVQAMAGCEILETEHNHLLLRPHLTSLLEVGSSVSGGPTEKAKEAPRGPARSTFRARNHSGERSWG